MYHVGLWATHVLVRLEKSYKTVNILSFRFFAKQFLFYLTRFH